MKHNFTPVKMTARECEEKYGCFLEGDIALVVETENILGVASQDADKEWQVDIIVDGQIEVYNVVDIEQASAMVQACVTRYQLMHDNGMEITLTEEA